MANLHFDRSALRNWTHDQLVSALIEAKVEIAKLNREVCQWQVLAESREEPYL